MAARRVMLISPFPIYPANSGGRARIASLLGAIKSLGHEVFYAHVELQGGDEEAIRREYGDHYLHLPNGLPYQPDRPTLATRWLEKVATLAPDSRRIFWQRAITQSDTLGLSYFLRKSVASLFNRPGAGQPEFFDLECYFDYQNFKRLQAIQRELRCDTVVVEYIYLSWACCAFDRKVLKIIDTVDRHSDRHKLYEQIGVPLDTNFFTSRRRETQALQRADRVIAIQHKEANFFRSIARRPVFTVGHIAELIDSPPAGGGGENPEILYIGSDYIFNNEGSRWLLEEIFPRVQARVPGARLHLVGGIADAVPDRPGVTRTPYAEDLKMIYARASVVVCPVPVGSGLKIKNLEALAFGCALVTTTAGAQGIEDGADTAYLMADDPETFAAHLIRLLQQPEYQAAFAQRALAYARRWNAEQLASLEAVLR